MTLRRIGSLIPSPNTIIEREFNRVLPARYQLHVGRLRMGPINEAGWRMQDADVDYQAELLGAARVEMIILAQTSASYFAPGYDTEVKARIAKASGAKAMTGGEILGQALHALGLRRIVFLSPYDEALNARARTYYEERHAVEVAAIATFGRPKTSGDIGALTTDAATETMARLDGPAIDGFLLAGGNYPTLHAIADWERQFGKPVVTTNQSALWAAFQAFGGGDTLAGYGRLLEPQGSRA